MKKTYALLFSKLVGLLVVWPLSMAARETEPKQVATLADVKPGVVASLKSEGKGMTYVLHVPRSFDPQKGSRLIVFLHGSNMNGLTYLRSFEEMKWGKNDVLCCPNGENAAGSDAYNFGFDSAPAVAEITEALQQRYKPKATYIGGHSQGGFLTYSVITHFPKLYQGAFPMAGDCWMQNEPNLWEDKPEILAAQRRIAIATIHGRSDGVVAFSQGQHGYDCFRAMGWSKVRLFAPEKLGHQFMLSPVDEALEWLDAMNGLDARQSLSLAGKWAKQGEWGWARHAAGGSASALKACEDAAAKAVTTMTAAMKGKPEAWVPQWVEFWRIHGAADAAKPLVEAYVAKRRTEQGQAAALFAEAQAHFRSSKKEEAYGVLTKLLETAPHTYQAIFAATWLSEKK